MQDYLLRHKVFASFPVVILQPWPATTTEQAVSVYSALNRARGDETIKV